MQHCCRNKNAEYFNKILKDGMMAINLAAYVFQLSSIKDVNTLVRMKLKFLPMLTGKGFTP